MIMMKEIHEVWSTIRLLVIKVWSASRSGCVLRIISSLRPCKYNLPYEVVTIPITTGLALLFYFFRCDWKVKSRGDPLTTISWSPRQPAPGAPAENTPARRLCAAAAWSCSPCQCGASCSAPPSGPRSWASSARAWPSSAGSSTAGRWWRACSSCSACEPPSPGPTSGWWLLCAHGASAEKGKYR